MLREVSSFSHSVQGAVLMRDRQLNRAALGAPATVLASTLLSDSEINGELFVSTRLASAAFSNGHDFFNVDADGRIVPMATQPSVPTGYLVAGPVCGSEDLRELYFSIVPDINNLSAVDHIATIWRFNVATGELSEACSSEDWFAFTCSRDAGTVYLAARSSGPKLVAIDRAGHRTIYDFPCNPQRIDIERSTGKLLVSSIAYDSAISVIDPITHATHSLPMHGRSASWCGSDVVYYSAHPTSAIWRCGPVDGSVELVFPYGTEAAAVSVNTGSSQHGDWMFWSILAEADAVAETIVAHWPRREYVRVHQYYHNVALLCRE
jgi:hypothetical protein